MKTFEFSINQRHPERGEGENKWKARHRYNEVHIDWVPQDGKTERSSATTRPRHEVATNPPDHGASPKLVITILISQPTPLIVKYVG